MSNPIKYSTGSETLALKKGNFYIGTGDVGKGPTSSTGYYNGISPPTGGYTIYLNKETGGPSIYTASNDAQLISLTNSIAGQSYTTVNECLVYYASQTDKVCLNRDYEGIITDGLVLNLDAGFTASYPKNGTTWYDVGGSNNGTLTNGPTFSTDGGGSIVFDGANDYVDCNSSIVDLNSSFTFASWVKTTSNLSDNSNFRRLIGRGDNSSSFTGEWAALTYNTSGNAFAFEIDDDTVKSGMYGTISLNPNTWYYVVGVINRTNTLYLYVNGVLDSTATDNTSLNVNPPYNLYLGAQRSGGNPFFILNGNLPVAQIYNRALSATEILQNYNAQKGRFGL